MGAFKIPAVLPPSPKGQCHLVKDFKVVPTGLMK